MDEVAIRVDGVNKSFVLPHERPNSVKSLFVSPFKSKLKNSKEIQKSLTNISFSVKKGEFFGIVGRNGSGKSTLLKILAGIYQPNSGNVKITGRLVPFIELGVGFNPELTGRENVYLNGALLGFSPKEIDRKYEAIVDFAELERFMDQRLKNYSSGMQVRLAFSVATILAESDILLIDEVLAVGDADFQRKCFNYFKKLKKDKKTVVFVSHDMEAVREYCDRALLIDDSRVVQIGETSKIAAAYTKLFNNVETQVAKAKSKDLRWGNFSAKSEGVECNVTEDKVRITHTIKANTGIEGHIMGFRIRSESGAHVLGTNTKIEGLNTTKLNQDEVQVLSWEFANVLSDGRYYVDAAILETDGITVIEWWDEAEIFVVRKGRHVPYPVDLPFSAKLT